MHRLSWSNKGRQEGGSEAVSQGAGKKFGRFVPATPIYILCAPLTVTNLFDYV